MTVKGFSVSRLLVLSVLVLAFALAAARAVKAYTTSNCFGGDLYIDFYDDATGGYRGFMRQRNSPQCPV